MMSNQHIVLHLLVLPALSYNKASLLECIGQHTPHPVMPSASATPTMVSGESQGVCFQMRI